MLLLNRPWRITATAGLPMGQGRVTAGTVAAFLAYVAMFFRPMEMLTRIYSQLLHSLAAADRVIEVLATEPKIVDPPDAAAPQDFEGEVAFDHVTFSYQNGTPVLRDVSFHVRPGEVIALVGGIDVTSEGSFPVFESNGIPQLGGVPVNLREQQSPVAFFFSGGTAGGMAAFMHHAAAEMSETVLIAHGDFPSFNVAARDYAAVVGESLGLEVELVSFAMTSSDFLPVLIKNKNLLIGHRNAHRLRSFIELFRWQIGNPLALG